MDFQTLFNVVLTCIAGILVYHIPVTSALQCYNCRGVTHYDPNDCFEPNRFRTMVQQCRKDEVCEKKIYQLSGQPDQWGRTPLVIERGCSSNCDGRTYVWTETFNVHCCGTADQCNHGDRAWLSPLAVLCGAAVWWWVR